MRILVLDTIHGGDRIGAAYAGAGHTVDCVDVYRGATPEAAERAKSTRYDLVVAPVHLNPSHPLLAGRSEPVITHHEAIHQLLGDRIPHPMIEITGSQGKTTTAFALAHILPGPGILHTSSGMFSLPGMTFLCKRGITPASVLHAAETAIKNDAWLVAEESLGVTGAGDLAIITSPGDYRCAAGKKSALTCKLESARICKRVLLAPGIPARDCPGAVSLDDVASVSGTTCTINMDSKSFTFKSPLLLRPGYRDPLALAGTAAVMLGFDPASLATFTGVPGRMEVRSRNGITIIDNANTGTNAETTVAAARYARECTGNAPLTLVIGAAEKEGKICEGFPREHIIAAVLAIKPTTLIWVGTPPEGESVSVDAICPTLEKAEQTALEKTPAGAIVLAVKTWR